MSNLQNGKIYVAICDISDGIRNTLGQKISQMSVPPTPMEFAFDVNPGGRVALAFRNKVQRAHRKNNRGETGRFNTPHSPFPNFLDAPWCFRC